jgi:dihydrofolate reductase
LLAKRQEKFLAFVGQGVMGASLVRGRPTRPKLEEMNMRKIIAATFVSLDGVMQAPGGPEEDPTGGFTFGGWTAPIFDEETGAALGTIFEKPFDLLLGRKTYDIFAAHWPYADPNDPVTISFNRVTKYVATRSGRTLDWQNSQSLGDDIVSTLMELKSTDGPDLLIQGSSDLIQTLLKHQLIDEFSLLIFPVLLGKGKRLFGAGTMPSAMKLTKSRSFASGVVMATYEPDGAVKTGSFALPEASAAEMERRKNLE